LRFKPDTVVIVSTTLPDAENGGVDADHLIKAFKERRGELKTKIEVIHIANAGEKADAPTLRRLAKVSGGSFKSVSTKQAEGDGKPENSDRADEK